MGSAALLAAALLAGPQATEADEPRELREVARVIDGDTLVLDGGERVRLIGVDTPETKHPQMPLETLAERQPLLPGRWLRVGE